MAINDPKTKIPLRHHIFWAIVKGLYYGITITLVLTLWHAWNSDMIRNFNFGIELVANVAAWVIIVTVWELFKWYKPELADKILVFLRQKR